MPNDGLNVRTFVRMGEKYKWDIKIPIRNVKTKVRTIFPSVFSKPEV
jgi:hypothetical protein